MSYIQVTAGVSIHLEPTVMGTGVFFPNRIDDCDVNVVILTLLMRKQLLTFVNNVSLVGVKRWFTLITLSFKLGLLSYPRLPKLWENSFLDTLCPVTSASTLNQISIVSRWTPRQSPGSSRKTCLDIPLVWCRLKHSYPHWPKTTGARPRHRCFSTGYRDAW